jgi:hypothetical protein
MTNMENTNYLFRCENCHMAMGPFTPSHLEHDEDGQDIWHCKAVDKQ